MTHDEAHELIDAWIDNELDPASASSVDRHIAECARCAERIASRRRLNDLLQAPGVRYAPPATAPLALARVAGAERRRSRWTAQTPWYRAAAAVLVVGTGGFWVGLQVAGSRALTDELVAAHVRATLSSTPIDVASSDHHTVKPWFADRLPFSPPVPEFGAGGDVLTGGRVDVIGRRRVAVLVYRHGNHTVEVYVSPAAQALRPGDAGSEVSGFNVAGARWHEFDVAWVSDANRAELEAFRQRWIERASEQAGS